MSVDLKVINGQVVSPDRTDRIGIAIDGGRFVALGREGDLPEARQTIDAKGLHVLPGLIDGHVHFRDPGYTYKEDFGTGSLAAISGGVTTVIDMPNTNPPTQDEATIAQKIEIASAKAYCDFGLVGVIMGTNVDKVFEMAKAGIVGYKCFLGETVGNLPSPDDGQFVDALTQIRQTGMRIGIHAENRQITAHMVQKLKAEGRTDPLAHRDSRPSYSENEAIARCIVYAKATGAKVHIYHLASGEGVELIRKGREMGVDITAETGPHYLLIDSTEWMPKLGSLLKMNPPVRDRRHAELLWDGLLHGGVDCIATDHSPHPPHEKLKDNIWEAIAGWPGVETAPALMFTQVNAGRLTLNKLVQLYCENPARVWNMWPTKGTIRIGSDADLTLVDMTRKDVIRAERLHSKSKITPFEGWQTVGKAVYTIVRGSVQMKDGEPVGPVMGRPVKPVL